MQHLNIAVFKELLIDDQPHYIWYRAGELNEEPLMEDDLLTEDELWDRLAID